MTTEASEQRWGSLALRMLLRSPDAVGPAVAAFGVVAVTCLLVGSPGWIALVLSSAVAVVAAWLATRSLDVSADSRRSDVLSVVALWCLTGAWTVFTALHVGQWFIVDRDPGFYAVASKYLASHDTYPIQTQAAGITAALPQLVDYGAGFYPAGSGEVYVQGGPLLPVLLGHLQRVFGSAALPMGNAALGGLALVALFAWSRRLVSAPWALIPSVAMGLSLPLLYVTRGTFSEVPALVVTMGGLALLTRGFAARSPLLASGGAATMSAATLGRIDGVAMLGVAIAVAVGFWIVTGDASASRRRTGIATLAAMLVVTLPALWTYTVVSPKYLSDLGPEVRLSVIAVLAVSALALVLVLVWPPLSARAARRAPGLGVTLARVTAALCAAALTFLAARPLFVVGRTTADPTSPYQQYVAGVQKVLGVTIDGARTYDEYTVVSTAWYFGWPVLVMSVAGLVVFVAVIKRNRLDPWAPFFGALVTLIPLYFLAWHNSPDQLWASRRLVVLGYPLLLIIATFAVATLLETSRVSLRWRSVGVLAAVLVMLVGAATALKPLVLVGQFRGLSSTVKDTCTAIQDAATSERPAAVIVTGGLAKIYVNTVGVFCGVPSVTAQNQTANTAGVAAFAAWALDHGYTPVQVTFDGRKPAGQSTASRVIRAGVPRYGRALVSAPSTSSTARYYVTVTALG